MTQASTNQGELMSGVNWNSDEAVVRAALPDGCYMAKYSDSEGDWYRVGGENHHLCWWFGSRDSRIPQQAWASARTAPTVVAYEALHNPAKRVGEVDHA